MKKLRLSIAIILLNCLIITVTCQSQTITDSCTCVPNSDLKKGAYWIERGQMLEEVQAESNKKIEFLNQRIADLQKILAEYETIDTTYQGIVESYRREVANLVKQRDIAVEAAKKVDKALRRQKRKMVFAILGTAAVVIGTYTLIK